MRFLPKKCGTTNSNITKVLLFRERKSNTGKIGSIFYISSTKRGYYYFFFGLHFILRQKKAAAIAIYITVLSCSMPIVKSYWFHCGLTKEIPTKLFVLWVQRASRQSSYTQHILFVEKSRGIYSAWKLLYSSICGICDQNKQKIKSEQIWVKKSKSKCFFKCLHDQPFTF